MKRDFHFAGWIRYFEENAKRTDAIPWDDTGLLGKTERAAIFGSIRKFQKGETGEGKYVFAEAKKYTASCGDDSYLYALKLFIYEEHRHARYLGDFMRMQEIPKQQKHWVDGIFRWIRHHGNLEVAISALVTAEVIAAVYYKALGLATRSHCLHAICRRILLDEKQHIRFQAYALNRIQKGRNRLLNAYMRFNHRILMLGTIPVVWIYHRRVFLAAGYSFAGFAWETWKIYRNLTRIVNASERQLLQWEQVM